MIEASSTKRVIQSNTSIFHLSRASLKKIDGCLRESGEMFGWRGRILNKIPVQRNLLLVEDFLPVGISTDLHVDVQKLQRDFGCELLEKGSRFWHLESHYTL